MPVRVPADAARVRATLRALRIEVDDDTATALADEDRDRVEQMRRLLDYDLKTVDSALELTRRGRR